MTLLETRLKSLLANTLWENHLRLALRAPSLMSSGQRPLPMRVLLDQALAQEFVDSNMHSEISSWMKLRNEAVHNSKPVSKAAANEVVTGVMDLLNKWDQF